MPRLRVGIVRYASVANAIAQQLDLPTIPDCEIGMGRITITLRGTGSVNWSNADVLEHAVRVAASARRVLMSDQRAHMRARSLRAIVVVHEEYVSSGGATITRRVECVVPAAHGTSSVP